MSLLLVDASIEVVGHPERLSEFCDQQYRRPLLLVSGIAGAKPLVPGVMAIGMLARMSDRRVLPVGDRCDRIDAVLLKLQRKGVRISGSSKFSRSRSSALWPSRRSPLSVAAEAIRPRPQHPTIVIVPRDGGTR